MNKRKKAVLASCFLGWYDRRLKYIQKMLESKDYEVYIVISDFDHHLKKRAIHHRGKNIQIVHTLRYKKNKSIGRLLSHMGFGVSLVKKLKILKPDFIWCLVPPNIAGAICGGYKKRHPDIFLIVDVIDMWPEAMGSEQLNKQHFFKIWKNLRDRGIHYADRVVVECKYYQERMNIRDKSYVLRLFDKEGDNNSYIIKEDRIQSKDEIRLCYLGSINSVIDIEGMISLAEGIKNIGKRVTFNIIGDGESREKLIKRLKYQDVDVNFFGAVFDEKKKQEIMLECDFGINLYKSNIVVGLTMKSIEYLKYSLPIINSIKGDTAELVEEYKMGINYERNMDISSFLLDASLMELHDHARRCYEDCFTKEAFINAATKVLEF